MTSTYLITGGTLIDGTGAAPVPNTGVLLQGDQIAAVGGDLVEPFVPDAFPTRTVPEL